MRTLFWSPARLHPGFSYRRCCLRLTGEIPLSSAALASAYAVAPISAVRLSRIIQTGHRVRSPIGSLQPALVGALWGQLARVESTRTDHAYIVVRERSVHFRQFILRHMAGDAIAGRYLADRLGHVRSPRLRAEAMARQALGVIGARFVNKRLMRVVTGHAGNPPVARCSPAAALLEAIRLKAYSRKTDLAMRLHHIRPCAVTSRKSRQSRKGKDRQDP
jgi:hypothetical protein